jgi:hypothetical protein
MRNDKNYRNRVRDSSSIAYGSHYHHYLKDEHPNSIGYWISELESLGISPKGTKDLDTKEVRDFVDNLKQVLLEEFRVAHDNSQDAAHLWT